MNGRMDAYFDSGHCCDIFTSGECGICTMETNVHTQYDTITLRLLILLTNRNRYCNINEIHRYMLPYQPIGRTDVTASFKRLI